MAKSANQNEEPENNDNVEDDEPQKLDLTSSENIVSKDISTEMEECYLDYAMSVIVARALPDVRDGLKPVHRRILFSMNELGLRSTAKTLKSARVVGDVLGKYHPHGDIAVYDSMVRMAQDFSMRYPLVNGQGNFGSIDGDSAAAMRYTEAKMTKISDEMLADIDKETVDWNDNYDGTQKEPSVLPAKIPQLLLNGTTGIAVGMATSIPPHNINEVIDGTVHLLDNPEATIDDLMQHIKGPDFPTGGIIYDLEAIKNMYVNGRGGIIVRSKTEIVEKKNGKFVIVVNEIPYQVNKANMVIQMANLVRDKKITGIHDIRDESNKDGIRVVIELKKDSYPKKILNQLFKMTSLQSSFNMNLIALVDGLQPRLLNLKEVLEFFIEHRKIVIRKRTEYDLRIAKARAHILEGLKIALDNIDAVISTIRGSETKEIAHAELMKKFKLSDEQAKAIMEMRLQTLAGLERKKIDDEYNEKMALIAELESILADEKKILNIIKEELAEAKEKYGDERRTDIVAHAPGRISSKDTIPNEPMMVMLSRENYIKRISPNTFRRQARGGKGVIGSGTKEEDEIKIIRYSNNHDNLLYFTNKGRVFKLPVYEIPTSSRTAKGQPIVNLLQLQDEEVVTSILNAQEEFSGEFLFMATQKGTVKKTPIKEFEKVRKSGLIAMKLRDGDSLEWVKETSKGDQVTIVTRQGKSIRFDEGDARPMGRPSMGVRGISLKPKDEVVEMDVVKNPAEAQLLIITAKGLGKSTNLEDYRLQARGGTGVKTANVTAKTGEVIGAKIIDQSSKGDLILISKNGQTIRMDCQKIPSQGRATQGVYLMRLNSGDTVSSLSLVNIDDEGTDTDPAKGEETENEDQGVLIN